MITRPKSPEPAPAQPVAWRLLLIPAVAQLLLHLLTNGNYGIFRDEYYYLACAERPGLGYVDHPPLSIWLLAGWKAVFGTSVQSIRVLPALCGATLVLLTGALAALLGGRRTAQLLAGCAAAIGAAGLVLCGFYSMNAYDMLFWTGAYYLLARLARGVHGRNWIPLGLLLGLGLLNKIGLLVFGLALALALPLTDLRSAYRERSLWLAGGVALLGLAPYLLWNAAHEWPTLDFIRSAQEHKITSLSPLVFLQENILEANPATLPLWVGGLLWLMLARCARRFRLLGLVFVLSFAIMVLQKSKPYYLGPSFPAMLAAGGVGWEGWTRARRWLWTRWLLGVGLLAGALVFTPIAVPLLSLDTTVAYMRSLNITPETGEARGEDEAPQYFSDRFGWKELARAASEVYLALPPDERENCLILGNNYGHSGALEYWSRSYELPPVTGRHNSNWLWGPRPEFDQVLIITGFSAPILAEYFESVEAAGVAVAETRWARESRTPIWVCRGMILPAEEVWAKIRLYI